MKFACLLVLVGLATVCASNVTNRTDAPTPAEKDPLVKLNNSLTSFAIFLAFVGYGLVLVVDIVMCKTVIDFDGPTKKEKQAQQDGKKITGGPAVLMPSPSAKNLGISARKNGDKK